MSLFSADYVRELVRRGFIVIPVKGRGRALEEAKQPLIPRGFRYDPGCRPKELAVEALKRFLRGEATAIGVPGINNRLIILDIERTAVEKIGKDRLLKLFEGTFIEESATGGLHVAFIRDVDHDGPTGVHGLLDNKTRGYIVTYPSVLHAGGRVYSYRLLGPPLWKARPYSEYEERVRELVSMLGGIYSESRCGAAGESKSFFFGVSPRGRQVVSAWDVRALLGFLQLVADSIGCGECVKPVVEALLEGRPLPVPPAAYPARVERGLHCTFEVELFGALFLLGASEEQLLEVASMIERCGYIGCHGFRSPPASNVKYNTKPSRQPVESSELVALYSADGLSIAYMGACPLLFLNRVPSCVEKLTFRVSRFIERDYPTLYELMDVVDSDCRRRMERRRQLEQLSEGLPEPLRGDHDIALAVQYLERYWSVGILRIRHDLKQLGVKDVDTVLNRLKQHNLIEIVEPGVVNYLPKKMKLTGGWIRECQSLLRR